jgi:sugar phosphate isomerase/epimerase
VDRIGIDHLSVFGMPPVEHVTLTADLGCHYVTLAPTPITPFNPQGYPVFSLRTDAGLRRETVAAMRDRGVSLAGGSGFLLGPDTDIAAYAADLAVMAELGAPRINAVSMDADRSRGFDNFARLAELAGTYGLGSMVEIVPTLLVGDVATTLELIRHVGRDDFRVLIDTMHVTRAGITPADLAAIEPWRIGYIQLCDAPLAPATPNYSEEVTFHRLVPGDGELPLRALMAALPRDVVVGLEIPMKAQAEAGVGPYERMRPCVEAARRLLSELDASA